MTPERYAGCLLGLALGDACGAPYEGGPIERLLWRLIGRTAQGKMRWTDDTQMSLDLADSLIAKGTLDPDDLARRFAVGYRWSRGYGPGAARLLKRIRGGADWREANRSVYPEGSFGNGGAMRSPVAALFYAQRPQELVAATRVAASITHAHPLGVEGALLIASATALALDGKTAQQILDSAAKTCHLTPFTTRLALAATWLQSGDGISPRQIARQLGHGISASESCVTALYLALRFLAHSFDEMLEFIAHVGGDVDTIGAMAGAVWGAARGIDALPQQALRRLEQADRLRGAASALFVSSRQAFGQSHKQQLTDAG